MTTESCLHVSPLKGAEELMEKWYTVYCRLLTNNAEHPSLKLERACVSNGPRVESGLSHDQVSQVGTVTEDRGETQPEPMKSAFEGLWNADSKIEARTQPDEAMGRVKSMLREMLQASMDER